MSDIITFMNTLGAAAKQTAVDLTRATAAHAASVDSSGGRIATGGGPRFGKTTATNEGYGFAGEVIAGLKRLQGRT